MSEIQGGQKAALSVVVSRYYGALFSYLYRYTGNYSLAEDLVQETFVALLKQRSYQPGKLFRPWLYTIATNLARNYFKSAAVRHGGGSLDPPSQSGPDNLECNEVGSGRRLTFNPAAGDPLELILRREESQEIAAAFGQLAEEYRLTLILRFYSELSLAEISDILGIPLGTVKSRLSVGVRKLRALLEASRQLEEGIGGK